MSGETSLEPNAPQWMLSALQQVPQDRAIGLLLRHADREALLKDFVQSYIQPLTEVGRQRSLHLGKELGSSLVRCHSSPLTRCMETVQYLQQGAGTKVPIVSSPLLGNPGVFVQDANLAAQTWTAISVEHINDSLSAKDAEPLPGLARGYESSMFAIQHFLSQMDDVLGVHVFCSHDSIVGPICSQVFGTLFSVSEWPFFLEGVIFWRDGLDVHFCFRTVVTKRPYPLCPLQGSMAIEYAKWVLHRCFEDIPKACFYVAGGMYKALLTGRLDSDIDIWAKSESDHKTLIDALLGVGAKEDSKQQYCRVFKHNGHTIEIAEHWNAKSLSELLGKFDISLSGIGVQVDSDGSFQCLIRKEFFESQQAQEVRLLFPLAKPKYLLTTLERMERYAVELGYALSLFDIQQLLEKISSVQFGSSQWRELVAVYRQTSRNKTHALEEIDSEDSWSSFQQSLIEQW